MKLALFTGFVAAGCGGSAGSGPVDAGGRADVTAVDAAGDGRSADAGDASASLSDGPTASPEGGGLDAPAESSAPARLVAYASGYAPDITQYTVDPQTGALGAPSSMLAAFGTAPSFLAVDAEARHLYAVDESTPGQVGAYAIDPSTGALTFQNAVASGGDGPPYVGVDGPWVFVANYTSGTVAVLPVKSDGSLGTAVDTESPGMLAHMIVADPTGHFVFVPCKGSDYVAQYRFDAATGKLTPNAVPTMPTAKGAGPRHLAFHPSGSVAYLIDETASTMSRLALDVAHGTLSIVQTVSTLPVGFTGTNTAAEVHVHLSGRWLFGSNRGDDSIVVFAVDPGTGKLTHKGHTKTGGAHPRDFTLDPTGR
ncbi:MAG TPA: lactonase family protein, partial [Polyangiaceae bacterium]|nr:lactonase family protein [Polyangiaceae bacterium]